MEAISATRPCQLCGRSPARELVIRRHVGMVFLQKFVKAKPHLCRDCGQRTIRAYTLRTLWQGWWGAISLWANLFTITMNLVALKKARSLGAPELSSPLVPPAALAAPVANPVAKPRADEAARPVAQPSRAELPQPGTPAWDDYLADYARQNLSS